jgi:rare lipoprotein A
MGRRTGYAAVALVAVLASGCAHRETRSEPPAGTIEQRAPPREEPEVGLASYYARSLQGRRTASGDRYDGREMTCAHRRYAFGTVLRVTDLETGRSVEVTVTDRGPFTEGRVIDLSRAAARRLGMLERGVARVRIERVQ